MKKVRNISNKIILPNKEDISNAAKIFNDQSLAFYQALYEYDLTNSFGTGKYQVIRNIYQKSKVTTSINIENKKYPYYSFDAKTPEEALQKIELIENAIKEKKEKFDNRVCCPLAEKRFCVCSVSFTCPIHGGSCIGSHD